MLIPPVSRYMTSSPHHVGPRDTLASVKALMREHKIRHAPVVDGETLVGIVSEQDVATAPHDDTVADIMGPTVSTLAAETPVDAAVALMHTQQIDAVIIGNKHRIEGIFTLADVLRAFCELIHSRGTAMLVRTATEHRLDRASDTD